jgi:molybdopterin synthase catalytic subunit
VSDQAGVHEKGTFTLEEAIKNAKSKKDFQKAGAIATFIGVVRGENVKNEIVQRLVLEAYEEKANEVLARICSDLRKRKGIVDVQIHHLLGEFHVGEDLVYVLVAGSHREDVFPVLDEAVERYKKEAPVFKKEYRIDEKGKTRAQWIGESKTR